MNNIILLFGGDSVEHEISIITAIQIYNKYKGKYNLIPVYLKKGSFYYINKMNVEYFKSNSYSTKIEFTTNCRYFKFHHKKISFLAIWLVVHGKNLEDGCLYSYFKTMNIPCIGMSQYEGAICHDKEIAKRLSKVSSLPYYVMDKNSIIFNLKDVIKNACRIGYPLIIKPARLGSSIGISIVKDSKELLEKSKYIFNLDDKIIIEKYLENFVEYNIAVLKNKDKYYYSEIEKIKKGSFLTYQDKYFNDDKSMASEEKELPAVINHSLRREIINKSLTIAKNLNISGVIRIDYLFDKIDEKLYFNEINNIPGSLSFYLFEIVNIDVNDLVNIIIDNGLNTIEENMSRISSYSSNIFLKENISSIFLKK